MEFRLEMPSFSDTDKDTLRKLRSYLFRLNEELRFVLSNIDAQNFTPEITSAISNTQSVKKEVAGLKESIINTASFIKNVEEKITATLKSEYTAVSDIGRYTNEAIASYEIDGKGIDQYFNVVSAVNEEVTKLCGYIKTGVLEDGIVGLEIANFASDGTAPFKVRLSDNRLAFYAGSEEVAYMSDSTLYITKAHVTGTLILGRYHIDLTDGIAFKWME